MTPRRSDAPAGERENLASRSVDIPQSKKLGLEKRNHPRWKSLSPPVWARRESSRSACHPYAGRLSRRCPDLPRLRPSEERKHACDREMAFQAESKQGSRKCIQPVSTGNMPPRTATILLTRNPADPRLSGWCARQQCEVMQKRRNRTEPLVLVIDSRRLSNPSENQVCRSSSVITTIFRNFLDVQPDPTHPVPGIAGAHPVPGIAA